MSPNVRRLALFIDTDVPEAEAPPARAKAVAPGGPSRDAIHLRTVALRQLQAELRGQQPDEDDDETEPELTEHQQCFRYGTRQRSGTGGAGKMGTSE